MTTTAPLTIVARHIGVTGTRFIFSDRAQVTATDDGRTYCIGRACLCERITDRCAHIELVKSLAPSAFDAIPLAGW